MRFLLPASWRRRLQLLLLLLPLLHAIQQLPAQNQLPSWGRVVFCGYLAAAHPVGQLPGRVTGQAQQTFL